MAFDDRQTVTAADQPIALAGKTSPSNREKILDAAVQVAIREGILAMTLDAVAKEAGVSKGGLIHHFRSKDDLIAAMLESFSTRALGALEQRMAGDANPQGRWLRALLQTVFPQAAARDGASAQRSEMARFMTAMLAASANNPRLIDPMRNRLARMLEGLLAEGPNGLRQVALWPAVYGLLLWQHLGVISPGDSLFRSMLDELLELAEGPVPPVAGKEKGRAGSTGARKRTRRAPSDSADRGRGGRSKT